MHSLRKQVIELIQKGVIPAEKITDALIAVKIAPDGKAWLVFINQLLLWVGGLALAFSVMFFIAYNWNDIGRFTKFGTVETLIVLSILAYWKLGEDKAAGKISLLVATLLLGVLLALFGQTYQTGADPWQLFFYWALLMLPWTLIGCFPALWFVWILLINLSIVLYHQAFNGVFWFMFRSDMSMLWMLFFFNTLALITWELLVNTWRWQSERWVVRVLAIGSGVPINWLVLNDIITRDNSAIIPGFAWVIWLVALFFSYRKLRPDLFMLAGGCLSGIVILVSFLSMHIFKSWNSGGLLFLALLVIGLGTGAAVWLKNVHREWQT